MGNLRFGFLTFLAAFLFSVPSFNGVAAEVSLDAPPSSDDAARKINIPLVRMGRPGLLPNNAVNENKCLKNIFEGDIKKIHDVKTVSVSLVGGENLIFTPEDSGDLFPFFYRYFFTEKGKTIKNFVTLEASKAGECRYRVNTLNGAPSDNAFILRVSQQ